MADVLPAELVVLYQVRLPACNLNRCEKFDICSQDAFFELDTDKDGVIQTRLLGELLRSCGENPTDSEVQV
jgi:hypothetical protein